MASLKSGVGVVTITALIGPSRRPPAVFYKHFEPFAITVLSLTGIAVGVSHFSLGESSAGKARGCPGAQGGD